jgi:hypothetical protein
LVERDPGKLYTAYMLDISQYTGARKRREMQMVEFWKRDELDRIRRGKYVLDPVALVQAARARFSPTRAWLYHPRPQLGRNPLGNARAWMMLRAFAVASVLVAVFSGSFSCQQRDVPLDELSAVDSSVVWETAAVRADVNGDGSVDAAYLGRARGRIYVGLVLGGSGIVSILDFAISSGIQDAICSEPATLSIEDLDYPIEEVGPLEGVRSSTNAVGLRLSGGQCDSIHLYWNHDRNQLSWWRL